MATSATPPSRSESLFLQAIRQSIDEWHSFQCAIDAGMGGRDAPEKVMWMGEVIDRYFNQNDGLTPDEVEDYIAEILWNEFDTSMEDDSLVLLATNLCRFYSMFKRGEHDQLIKLLQERKAAYETRYGTQLRDTVSRAQDQASMKKDEASSSSDEDQDDEEECPELMDTSEQDPAQVTINAIPTAASTEHESRNEPDADGWIEVNRKKGGKRR